MKTEEFDIEIIQTRHYTTGRMHYARVRNRRTGKIMKDWFPPFDKETLDWLKTNINWSVGK